MMPWMPWMVGEIPPLPMRPQQLMMCSTENRVRGKEAMPHDFNVLVDSDAFVGRFYPNDAHYEHSRNIFQKLKAQRQRLVTTSFVVAETATVLSHRQGQDLARDFLRDFIGQGNIDVIYINEALYQAAIAVFLAQKTKGTSMTDCANVVVMQRYGISQIFSFDKVYSRAFDLQTAG
jgi:predicted nucleic acid-binding protein